MKRKAQIQMGESIAIIIVVIILLIFALVFYSKLKESSISEKDVLYEELDIVQLSDVLYSLPEIQCSFAEVYDYGCVDALKVYYLTMMINESFISKDDLVYFYYREIFGTSKITIEMINSTGGVTSWILYNNSRDLGEKNVVHMPLIIYDPISDANAFGVMIIEKYNT